MIIEIANITTESNKSVVEVYCNKEGKDTLTTFVNYINLKKQYDKCLNDLKELLEEI